jgi:hypothetical protein
MQNLLYLLDNLAEWSKAHVSGTCLNWRGFESLSCHSLLFAALECPRAFILLPGSIHGVVELLECWEVAWLGVEQAVSSWNTLRQCA